MSVVINDFEILTDSSGDETAGEGESEAGSSPARASIRPIDVIEIVERNKRRHRRLRAH